mmetsp:Transcript_79439/g.171666  ORF Transcript_79439/g.171666 Transcript_79439/m.171666 type:complete len:369 (+) Transcript_79439:224-1330(+)
MSDNKTRQRSYEVAARLGVPCGEKTLGREGEWVLSARLSDHLHPSAGLHGFASLCVPSIHELLGEADIASLQVFFVDLDVEVAVVLHHHADHVLDDAHLGDQLVDVGVVEELQRLCTALLLGVRPREHHAPHRVTLEDGVADADDVLPALVGVAGVEAVDLLCEGHLLPVLGRHLIEALVSEAAVEITEAVLSVCCVQAWQSLAGRRLGAGASRARRRRPAGARRPLEALRLVDGAGIDHGQLLDQRHERGQEVLAGGLHPRLHGVRHDDHGPQLHRELQQLLVDGLELPKGPLELLHVGGRLEEAQGRSVLADPVGGAERVVPVEEDDGLGGLEVLRLAAGAHHGLYRLPDAGLHAVRLGPLNATRT